MSANIFLAYYENFKNIWSKSVINPIFDHFSPKNKSGEKTMEEESGWFLIGNF